MYGECLPKKRSRKWGEVLSKCCFPERNCKMDKVISCFEKRPDAVSRLICFPWAGGGSIHYARWGTVLSSSIEVFAVRLPGRESRAKEPFFRSMQQIVDEVVGTLLPVLREKPFALFGHSFGAFASLAVADALKTRHHLEPAHVFLSGASAPHSETRLSAPRKSDLSEEDFLEWLTLSGGTPPELLADPDVLKLFLPALKADLLLVETFSWSPPQGPLLACPVTCFDGEDDVPHDLQAWKSITSGDFTIRKLPGSHFYLKDPRNEKVLLDYITQQLETSDMDYL